MANDLLLKLDGIVKDFPGTRALNNVKLEVGYGEVHAVIGENGAGKSTLMNIISGVFPQTKGTIEFEGKSVSFKSTLDAQKVGIGIVHQEISLCPHISVEENIFMGRLPKRAGVINHSELTKKCTELLKNFNSPITPKQKISSLTIAQQQIVEIIKALSMNCKLLILDEPTSSLTESETRELFKVIARLKSKGISILYISHRLSEIFEICDRITVFRDGEYIGSENVKDIDNDALINMMVGRSISTIYPRKSDCISDEILLEADSYTSANGRFIDASFDLHKGEILGFSGLIGAGRTELMRAICGIDVKKSGTVKLWGEKLQIANYQDALDKGIVYITENRKEDGLFLDYNIEQNITSPCLNKIKKGAFLNNKKQEKISEEFVQKLKIKVFSLKQLCSSLSGGNQQKVLLAKYLTLEPKVLIVDEPTRGIDVGVRLDIYKMLRELAMEGIGIIVVSSDLTEIIGLCDRVIVMAEGKITGSLEKEELDENKIMKYASV